MNQEITITETQISTQEPIVSFIKTCSLASFLGLVFAIVAVFMPFLPILKERWLDCGSGFVVMLFSFVALILLLYNRFFWVFFINIFNMYFLFNETLVIYDGRAVEMGREIATETAPGYFRSAIEVFIDAFKFKMGAGLAFYGILAALLFGLAAWVAEVVYQNNQAIKKA
jgi:uncharacterized membrane protein YhaH (DUF805 family)